MVLFKLAIATKALFKWLAIFHPREELWRPPEEKKIVVHGKRNVAWDSFGVIDGGLQKGKVRGLFCVPFGALPQRQFELVQTTTELY